jgi:hypothetical protein
VPTAPLVVGRQPGPTGARPRSFPSPGRPNRRSLRAPCSPERDSNCRSHDLTRAPTPELICMQPHVQPRQSAPTDSALGVTCPGSSGHGASSTPVATEGARSRRYLQPVFGCLRCSRRRGIVCFCRGTKRLLRERCSATCLRRRRSGQVRRGHGGLEITAVRRGRRTLSVHRRRRAKNWEGRGAPRLRAPLLARRTASYGHQMADRLHGTGSPMPLEHREGKVRHRSGAPRRTRQCPRR